MMGKIKALFQTTNQLYYRYWPIAKYLDGNILLNYNHSLV